MIIFIIILYFQIRLFDILLQKIRSKKLFTPRIISVWIKTQHKKIFSNQIYLTLLVLFLIFPSIFFNYNIGVEKVQIGNEYPSPFTIEISPSNKSSFDTMNKKLSQDFESILVFEYELQLNFQGNTHPGLIFAIQDNSSLNLFIKPLLKHENFKNQTAISKMSSDYYGITLNSKVNVLIGKLNFNLQISNIIGSLKGFISDQEKLSPDTVMIYTSKNNFDSLNQFVEPKSIRLFLTPKQSNQVQTEKMNSILSTYLSQDEYTVINRENIINQNPVISLSNIFMSNIFLFVLIIFIFTLFLFGSYESSVLKTVYWNLIEPLGGEKKNLMFSFIGIQLFCVISTLITYIFTMLIVNFTLNNSNYLFQQVDSIFLFAYLLIIISIFLKSFLLRRTMN